MDVQDLSDYYSRMAEKYSLMFRQLLYDRIYDIICQANNVVTVTEPFKKILELRIGRKNIPIIYNGVDVDLYSKEFNNLTYKDKSLKEITCIFAGDLNWRYHMVEKIITAVAIITKKYKKT